VSSADRDDEAQPRGTAEDAVAALRESEERTRLILEGALDAVVTMDGAGLVTGWNPQAERIFGWSAGEALGRSMAETIIPAHLREAHRRGLESYLRTGHGPILNRRIETMALHRSGRTFPVELTVSPLRRAGEPVFSAFIRDISDRKRAEERLRRLVSELDHRVRNNLAALVSLVNLYERTGRSGADLAAVIRGKILAMKEMHDLIRTTPGEPVELGTLVQRLATALAPDQGRVDTGGCRDPGPPVRVAPEQTGALAMVVQELLTNSLKHGALGAEAGRVMVACEVADEGATAGDWAGAPATTRAYTVRWREAGGPPARPPADGSRGVGLRLVDGLARSDLRGAFRAWFEPSGFRCELRVRAPRGHDTDDPGDAAERPRRGATP
jgi:PAS domain S-box-containing protein